jgi:hypothetical protein
LSVPQFGQLMLYPIARAGPQEPGESVKLSQPTLLSGGERENRLIRDYALQLIYRLPQLVVRDFNGDGHADLIASWQDHVAVYLQNATGHFPQEPSQTFHFNLRTEQERTSDWSNLPLDEDLDGDGRADLILTKMTDASPIVGWSRRCTSIALATSLRNRTYASSMTVSPLPC